MAERWSYVGRIGDWYWFERDRPARNRPTYRPQFGIPVGLFWSTKEAPNG